MLKSLFFWIKKPGLFSYWELSSRTPSTLWILDYLQVDGSWRQVLVVFSVTTEYFDLYLHNVLTDELEKQIIDAEPSPLKTHDFRTICWYLAKPLFYGHSLISYRAYLDCSWCPSFYSLKMRTWYEIILVFVTISQYSFLISRDLLIDDSYAFSLSCLHLASITVCKDNLMGDLNLLSHNHCLVRYFIGIIEIQGFFLGLVAVFSLIFFRSCVSWFLLLAFRAGARLKLNRLKLPCFSITIQKHQPLLYSRSRKSSH